MLKSLVEKVAATYKQMEDQRRISLQTKSKYLQVLVEETAKEKCTNENQIAEKIIQWRDKEEQESKVDVVEGFFKNITDILVHCANLQLKQISPEYALKEIKKLKKSFDASLVSSLPLVAYFTSYSDTLIKDYNDLILDSEKCIQETRKQNQVVSNQEQDSSQKKLQELTEANKYFSSRNKELLRELNERKIEITTLKSMIQTLNNQAIISNIKNTISNQQSTPKIWKG